MKFKVKMCESNGTVYAVLKNKVMKDVIYWTERWIEKGSGNYMIIEEDE